MRRVDIVEESALEFAPFVHVAPRRNSITPEKQRRFIATLAATGIVSQAALSIGASVEALYKLRHRSGAEDFARAWDAAVEKGYARLEDCALERAIAGEERPVVSRGKVVATWTHHNTGLLMFLLRARRPEKYGAVRVADLREGHPVYDALKKRWERERAAEEASPEAVAAIRASLHAKLLAIRDEMLARRDGAPGMLGQGDDSAANFWDRREPGGEAPVDGRRDAAQAARRDMMADQSPDPIATDDKQLSQNENGANQLGGDRLGHGQDGLPREKQMEQDGKGPKQQGGQQD